MLRIVEIPAGFCRTYVKFAALRRLVIPARDPGSTSTPPQLTRAPSLPAFSPAAEPNLRLRMQVQLVNFAGLDEAGIDGGGIFREFMSELMKTAFDPNRGFFRHTSDQLLYPNPGARVLFEDFTRHYFFIGRILGKVSGQAGGRAAVFLEGSR